jgi:hypothetical protein
MHPQCLELKSPALASLARAREILKRDAKLIALPFGQIKYESRRSGSFLEFTFSYNNAKVCACAVSSQGMNRQFWDEIVTNYSLLQIIHAVPGDRYIPEYPNHSPWMASYAYNAFGLIKKAEAQQLIMLKLSLAFAFMIDSVTTSGADTSASGR